MCHYVSLGHPNFSYIDYEPHVLCNNFHGYTSYSQLAMHLSTGPSTTSSASSVDPTGDLTASLTTTSTPALTPTSTMPQPPQAIAGTVLQSSVFHLLGPDREITSTDKYFTVGNLT